MNQIILEKDNSSSKSLYIQLYEAIKQQLLSGDIVSGEKMPSVRTLADTTRTSTTTVIRAYDQLVCEGYIKSRAGSGYYAENVKRTGRDYAGNGRRTENNRYTEDVNHSGFGDYTVNFSNRPDMCSDAGSANVSPLTDPSSFDFVKWKKCISHVLTEQTDKLLSRSEPKGESVLREEIADYLLHSRGVRTSKENIIVAAGTQQTILQLGKLLHLADINMTSVEKPGYTPVRSMLADAGFTVFDIPVTPTGITIEKLPTNIPSAVYVNPSNQFPTGAVMPITARQQLLKWASDNNSYIIEDDYDSELRYFGRPLPSLKALDMEDRVIYLGSFSTTLFSSVKISYMVLPDAFVRLFEANRENYRQACSKTEQLALAHYMHEGYYYAAIRKKRVLFSRKLDAIKNIISELPKKSHTELANEGSGLSVIIKRAAFEEPEVLCKAASSLGILITPISEISNAKDQYFSLYYTDIPMEKLGLIEKLFRKCE